MATKTEDLTEVRTAADVEALDAYRYHDPDAALERAEAALAVIDPRLLPRLLGVYGSILRMKDRPQAAQRALVLALGLIRGHGELALEGELWQRLSYIVAARGNYRRALRLSRHATELHTRAGNLPGIGQSLVAEGQWLHYLEKYEDAVAANRAALLYLSREDLRHRYAACGNLAFTYDQLGQVENAAAAALKAEGVGYEGDRWFGGKLSWLRGSLAIQAGDHAVAESALRAAVDRLRLLAPIEAALAAIDLTSHLLTCGRVREAHAMARTMVRFIGPLKGLRHAQAAVLELNKLALAAKGLWYALGKY